MAMKVVFFFCRNRLFCWREDEDSRIAICLVHFNFCSMSGSRFDFIEMYQFSLRDRSALSLFIFSANASEEARFCSHWRPFFPRGPRLIRLLQ